MGVSAKSCSPKKVKKRGGRGVGSSTDSVRVVAGSQAGTVERSTHSASKSFGFSGTMIAFTDDFPPHAIQREKNTLQSLSADLSVVDFCTTVYRSGQGGL